MFYLKLLRGEIMQLFFFNFAIFIVVYMGHIILQYLTQPFKMYTHTNEKDILNLRLSINGKVIQENWFTPGSLPLRHMENGSEN